MVSQDYLPKLHTELLSIMVEVDRVCVSNGIKYYLVGGSLLGSIRHKGFIPWDDDLDIAMPRKDFEHFVSIANDKLSSCYELQWITTNKEYWQVFAKVIKRGTLFKERGLKKLSPTGIFIDIFPLDLSPQYSLPLEKKKLWINFISSIVWAKNSTDKGWKLLIAGLFSIRQLQRMMLCIMKSARKKGTTHYANFGSQYNLSKQTMPIEWYGEGVRMPFEDQLFIVPQEYNKVLTSIYGENYMSLPPEQKRRCHYPEKVVFSNGEEMAFENPIHIVTVKDQES